MKTAFSFGLSLVLGVVVILGVGCSSEGGHRGDLSSTTTVSLNHANYKVLRAGAMGRSYGFRFLLGIIPIASPSTAEARADLYASLGQSMNGKSIALANVNEDHSTTWLLLFSVPKIVITGDVVEFNAETNAPQVQVPLMDKAPTGDNVGVLVQ